MRTGPDQALTLACARALAEGWSPDDLAVPVTVMPDARAGQWRVKFNARDPMVAKSTTLVVDDRTRQVTWLPAL